MNQTEKRQISLGATRSEARHNGFAPEILTGNEMLDILDNLSRKEPELIASEWYRNASQNQLRLFTREHNKNRGI